MSILLAERTYARTLQTSSWQTEDAAMEMTDQTAGLEKRQDRAESRRAPAAFRSVLWFFHLRY